MKTKKHTVKKGYKVDGKVKPNIKINLPDILSDIKNKEMELAKLKKMYMTGKGGKGTKTVSKGGKYVKKGGKV